MASDGLSNVFSGSPVYKEEQRFRQWWLWLVVLGNAALNWWIFISQILLGEPFGSNPAPDWGVWVLWVVIGWGLPLGFYSLRLVVEVTTDAVIIRFPPFSQRAIPLGEIERWEIRSYHPIREYGGWGIKGWSRRNMVYNVYGHRGVQLYLRDGLLLMLGSQSPEELAQALELVRHRTHATGN